VRQWIYRKGWLLGLLLAMPHLKGQDAMNVPQKKDEEYNWLENLDSKEALDWVKAQNERSLAALRAYPEYPAFKEQALQILQAKDKIPYGAIVGGFVYNFWQDADHVRGIWRRATWDSYQSGKPQWDILLDVDALAKAEGKSYVFGGSRCLRPKFERCLVRLSEGGSDAAHYREFDIPSRRFVPDGFVLPASKSSLAWIDENQVFFDNALTPEVQTDSGYPIETRVWKRGTPLQDAKPVFSGQKSDVSVSSQVVWDQGKNYLFVYRALSFYTGELHALDGDKLVKLPLPVDIGFRGLFKGQLLFSNRSALAGFKPGSLLSAPYDRLLKGEAKIELIFAPNESQALDGIDQGQDYLYVALLDQVRNKVLRFERSRNGQWSQKTLPLDDKGTINLVSVDEESNRILLSYEDFLVPSSLYAIDGARLEKKLVQRIPARFKSEGLEIRQEFATSKDGVKVPYFVVHRKGLKRNGENPTLLYGYGGFEVSMQPTYAAIVGKLWLENGGVYALANIRGGGEFGPTWHQAALQENRQRAFDDFAAVAEDLIQKNITSSKNLGIQGGSNGGLLMGASFTQRPELFQAVICQVPLLDMLRYHKLLAGASWMAEYGNPDDPKMAAVLRTYSPFHNLRNDRNYPEVFFITSTKDDRVHPGHARKMAARMADLKKPFLYFENIEGGHSASANLQQSAERLALEYSYLWLKLRPQAKS